MPRYVVQRVQDALNERGRALRGAKVLVLGVAFKPGVSDTRESPALDVIGLLREKGAEVSYHDPHVPEVQDEGWGLRSIADPLQAAGQVDCVVIVTDHRGVDYPAIAQAARLVFDARNALAGVELGDGRIIRL
jgi:UDP-N-acetyl-D-glucosamine dehydrogenase